MFTAIGFSSWPNSPDWKGDGVGTHTGVATTCEPLLLMELNEFLVGKYISTGAYV